MKKKIIIDTDPAMGTKGGDPEDCFAIMLALNSPELEVLGITTVQGNVPVERGFSNACFLVNELEKNNIKVVLFSIPQHEHVIDSIEKSEIEDFKNLLIKLSNSNTYFLHDEYSQMNIWRESFHIAVHPDASIYTDDMYEIILKEIKE